MNLDCYDIGYDSQDGVLFVEALMDDEDGKRVERIPAPFKPYCYINEESLVMQTLRATGCRIGNDAPDGYLKIEGDHPNDIKSFRERYAFQTYEADVFYDTRVSIDEDITFAQPEPDQILYFDIEVDDRGQFTQPEDADSRVIAIAAVGGDGEEFYFDRGEERALLEGFLEAADDYVAMVGWNSLDYDFRYLKNRCANLGMTVHWDRWVLHDLMPLYDMLAIPTKTVSTKLEDTGERELGEGKTGVKPGEGRLWNLWNDDPDTLEEYNIRDAEIVKEIDEKYDLIRLLHVICDLCNYPPGGACYLTKHDQVRFAIGQVVDAKMLQVAKKQGIPQANKRSYTKPDDFPGGYVLEPKPGMYEWLMAPDYGSMYPNIIRAWNFGRETYVKPEHCAESDTGWVASGGAWEGHRIIKGETGGFVHPDDGPRSVPAKAADELVELRANSAEIVDKGIKAVNNTIYGIFAADHQRYFGPHSENITLVGQELTGTVERIADRGHEYIRDVVYGDTDSLMIDMEVSDDIATDEAIEAAKVVTRDIQDEMRSWAFAKGAEPKYLTLDLDDVYDRFYIGDKKKRYFGHRVFDGAPCDNFKVRGFETRQGNWPQPVRRFQEDLMHALLDEEPTGPIISEAKDKLFSGVWDMEMATSTKLGQPVDEYDPPMPHSRAAKQIRSHHGQSAIQVGDKVDYVNYAKGSDKIAWIYDGEIGISFRPNDGFCKECGEVVVEDDHEHETEAYPHFRNEHYSYMWSKQFESVMDSIGVSEGTQSGLGDFL